jgi:hypothetical protein
MMLSVGRKDCLRLKKFKRGQSTFSSKLCPLGHSLPSDAQCKRDEKQGPEARAVTDQAPTQTVLGSAHQLAITWA